MTIHSSHPFTDPERVLGRQFRGRLGNRVSLWCSGALGERGSAGAAGLTVSSVLVIPGDPWRLVGFIDPEAALATPLLNTGRATVSLLEWHHRSLADMFGGLAPAPGGPFAHANFEPSEFGPQLVDAETWAGVELECSTEVGWMLQVTCRALHIEVGLDSKPLHHTRGRYTTTE